MSPARADDDLNDSLSSPEIQRVEEEIQLIFTRYLTADSAGHLIVDSDAIEEDGKSVAIYQQIADGLNRNPHLADDGSSAPGDSDGVQPLHRVGSWAWGKCVLNQAIPGAGSGILDGAIVSWLEKGKYAKVASYLVRVIGRSALRGGVIGLATGLAVGVAWCSTPWAS